MRKEILFFTTILFLFTGKATGQYCTSASRYAETPFFDSTQISIAKDIQYGNALDFKGSQTQLLLDLYYPNLAIDKSPKRPFIMMIHGGGFMSGDKNEGDVVNLCKHLVTRGFVVASINYRMGDTWDPYRLYKARYRAIQDGHAALRFIVANANTYRIDNDWLFVGGGSAGALTALGIVYADESEADRISGLHSQPAISSVLGGLHTSGNNLTDTLSIKGIFNNWGSAVDSEIEIAEMVPTISFHGDKDPTVPINAVKYGEYTLNGSNVIHNALTANNICSELNVVINGAHGVYGGTQTIHRAERASCFFKSLFCNNCTRFYTTAKIPSNCSTILNSEEIILGSTPKVYPNPFETSFRINNLDGLLELTVYNCLNQLVYKNKTANGVAQIDLKPGIYFLNVKQVESNNTFTTKLIKK